MSESTRNLFHARKPQREDAQSIKVLVSLVASPDDASLAELQAIGLKVESVSGNKLAGEIESKLIATLQEHVIVVEVERSVELKPTDDGDCGID